MKFKEGKIIDIFNARKNGKDIDIIIRYPKKSDVLEVWRFYNKVIKETNFLSRIRPVSFNEEKKWIEVVIKGMKNKKKIVLAAECNRKIIGTTSVEKSNEDSHHHTGTYGIAILQNYTGIGLGTRMTRHVIDVAKKELKLEIVKLNVYHKNTIAQRLYKKMGFKYVGKIPKGAKRKGKYMDEIIMYKVLK